MISVIIPVYNTAPYLDECIRSVTEQTYRDLEILLIDDCSTDGSSEILDKWAALDERIRVVHKGKNSGVSDSRNQGLALARGEYISFVDSDDWLEQEHYENLFNVIDRSGADIVVGGYTRVFSDKAVKVISSNQDGKVMTPEQALMHCMPPKGSGRYNLFIWNKLYRAAVLQKNGTLIAFDKAYPYCEDVVWLTRVMLNCRTVAFWSGCTYQYRARRSGSANSEMRGTLDMALCESAIASNRETYQLLEAAGLAVANNALQRLLVYQKAAFRAAWKQGEYYHYSQFRRGYIRGVLTWLVHNGISGAKWGLIQLAGDIKFQCKRVLSPAKR